MAIRISISRTRRRLGDVPLIESFYVKLAVTLCECAAESAKVPETKSGTIDYTVRGPD